MAKARTKRTDKKGDKLRRDWTVKFLTELAIRGRVRVACLKAGVGKTAAYERYKSDEKFAAAWDDAIELAVDLAEEELRRRGVEGTDKPVYQGGGKVGTVREYSDTCLIFYLKGRRPEIYREPKNEINVNVDAATVSGDVAKAALDAAAAKAASEGKG